ncbi:iron-containing alcohol dehydrogenase, partial [uncultured Duncaniella sp.]|uniref:iron-containing alcohol dehydrogenase n=1 Tax=uncultured Duncaniella sp. TaxID=2768039 RepID=UPI002729EADB
MEGRYCEMARFVGIQGKNDDEVFENFIKAIADLKAKVGIKRTIKEYGIKEEDFMATLSDLLGDSSILQLGKGNWGGGEYFNGYM